jgi:hypothetical protein
MLSTIPAGWRVAAAALSCGAMAAAVTGCGTTASTGSAVSGASGPSRHSAPASAPASASASAGPLAGLTADQIAGKAIADLKSASSFHVTGSDTESGQTSAIDLTYGAKDCRGTATIAGEGSILLLKKGKKLWAKPDNRFWRYIGTHMAGGLPSYALRLLEGKYLRPTTGRNLRSFGGFCDRGGFTRALDSDMGGMTKGKATTIFGRPALQIHSDTTTAYVTISAHPVFLRVIDDSGRGHLNLTRYNAPFSVTAPPASQTLDGAQYGF